MRSMLLTTPVQQTPGKGPKRNRITDRPWDDDDGRRLHCGRGQEATADPSSEQRGILRIIASIYPDRFSNLRPIGGRLRGESLG